MDKLLGDSSPNFSDAFTSALNQQTQSVMAQQQQAVANANQMMQQQSQAKIEMIRQVQAQQAKAAQDAITARRNANVPVFINEETGEYDKPAQDAYYASNPDLAPMPGEPPRAPNGLNIVYTKKGAGNVGAGFTREISDEEADAAMKQIAEGKISPTIVNKMFGNASRGTALVNNTKLLKAGAKLGLKDPITGEPIGIDLGDYEQSFKQEQKNKILYMNANNALKDMDLLVSSAEKVGNGRFADWNKLKLNFLDRTGNEAVAAFKAEAQAAIDSISLALGPANGTGATDKRLELAQKTVDQAQSVDQVRAAVTAIKRFVNNRIETSSSEGMEGWRIRNIPGYKPKESGTTKEEPKYKSQKEKWGLK